MRPVFFFSPTSSRLKNAKKNAREPWSAGASNQTYRNVLDRTSLFGVGECSRTIRLDAIRMNVEGGIDQLLKFQTLVRVTQKIQAAEIHRREILSVVVGICRRRKEDSRQLDLAAPQVSNDFPVSSIQEPKPAKTGGNFFFANDQLDAFHAVYPDRVYGCCFENTVESTLNLRIDRGNQNSRMG